MPIEPTDHESRRDQYRNLPRRSIAVLLLVGVGILLLHGQLLALAHALLVAHEPVGHCRYGMLVTPGPESYDATVQLLSRGSFDRVLIVDQKPRRSVVLGAMPALEDRITAELAARGLVPADYRIINTQAQTPHQMFRESDELIRDENLSPPKIPTDLAPATCMVISTETKSQYFRTVIDQALPANRSTEYRLHAVETPTATAINWWRSRGGVRQVMVHGLRLIFVTCFGESQVDPTDPYRHVVKRAISNE
jgi:hypothetical protein